MVQKMEATGWGRNLQLGIELFELWLSPELFRTGASGPEKSKLHQEKGFKMLMRFIGFVCSANTGDTEEGRKEAAGFRGRAQQELEVSSLELGQPCSPRAWAKEQPDMWCHK